MTKHDFELLQAELKKHFSTMSKEDLQNLYQSGYEGISGLLGLHEELKAA